MRSVASPKPKPVREKTGRPTLHQSSTPGPGTYSPKSSFGSGGVSLKSRTEKSKGDDTPGPGEYEQASSFGEGRKFSMKSRTAAGDFLHSDAKNVPGPGQYDVKSTLGEDGKKISMHGRTKNTTISPASPGPGQYNLKSTIGEGMKFSLSPRINTSPSRGQIPGPGQYDVNDNSQNHKIAISLGGRTPRFEKSDTPGPGAYSSPSKVGTDTPRFTLSSRYESYTAKSIAPGPGAYDVGSTIGKGRAPTIKGKLTKKEVNDNPGPGAYESSQVLGKEGPSFSLHSRPEGIRSVSAAPGPGQYDIKSDIGMTSPRYSLAPRLHTSPKMSNDTPGPGQYTVQNYTIASARGGPSLHSRIETKIMNSNPGPGQYELGSVFTPSGGKGASIKGKSPTKMVNEVPGPGQYDSSYLELSKQQPKITLKGRLPDQQFSSENTPGPGAYSPRSMNSKLAFTLKPKIPQSSADLTPGPGEYENPIQIGKEGPKVSLKSRPNNPSQPQLPGPGQYDLSSSIGTGLKHSIAGKIPSLNLKGMYDNPGPGQYSIPTSIGTSSKFSLSPRLPDTSQKTKAFVPGPGAYTPREPTTNIAVSLKSRSLHTTRSTNPGPGEYDVPSAIGQGPKHGFGTGM